jgi:tricorn protease
MQTGIIFTKEKPYVVEHVLKNSPSDKKDIRLQAGDVLKSINGFKVDPNINRDFYFTKPSVDQEITLGFERDGNTFEVKLHPESTSKFKTCLYDKWIEDNQKYVNQKSGDRIAYIQMKNMGSEELNNFIIEMTTEWYKKEALILDLRYNTGGNVHDAVLGFLSRKPYLQWKYRGGEFAPQPNFSPAEKPIVLLVNEQSLSDAEMTAAGFKALKLGKIIGTETYRWLIFTSGKSLVDGSFYRLPSWGCYTLDGKDIELNGVRPDIYVQTSFKDRLEEKDPQLDSAITEIIKELSGSKK